MRSVLDVMLALVPYALLAVAQTASSSTQESWELLKGRSDPSAFAEWGNVLDRMHVNNSPELGDAVQYLRSLDLLKSELWINLVNVGYAYTGDSAAAHRFRAEIARRLPDSVYAVQAAVSEWEVSHPPKSTAEAGFAQWERDRLRFLDQLHRNKPKSDAAAREYVATALALSSMLGTEQALAVADLALSRKLMPYDVRPQVARMYLDHHARIEFVPELVDAMVNDRKRELREAVRTGRDAEVANRALAHAQFQADCLKAEYWLLKSARNRAQSAIRQAQIDLARLAPAPDDPPDRRAFYGGWESTLRRVEKLAGAQPRPVLDSSSGVDWPTVGRTPLKDFEETDYEGRRWTLKDFAGRVVLVNMWATWCAPCRAELPFVQELHERLRGRADRLVISVNVDTDGDLARRLIREHGYTFPVINSRELADIIDFTTGVPQNRIVDSHGRLLAQGVEAPLDLWVAAALRAMAQISSSDSLPGRPTTPNPR